MKNKVWYIKAKPHWPVGHAGAVIITKNSKEAIALADTLGLLNPEKPKQIGESDEDTCVVFYNTCDY